MNTFKKSTSEVEQRVKKMVKKYHEDLVKAKVRVDVLFVDSDNEDGAPLNEGGYVADAIAKILPQEQRAAGRGDCVIIIDQQRYNELQDKERDALIDHELQHFQPVMKDGKPVWDGQDRPKLKMRKHDVQVGWFSVVAQRHGKFSMEVTQAAKLITEGSQIYLPGFDFTEKTDGKAVKVKTKIVAMPSQSGQPAQAAATAAAAK